MRILIAYPFASLTLIFVCAATTLGQAITVDVTNESAWTIVQDDDAAAHFGFDYSPFGIPPAPGSNDTLGVRLEANRNEPADAAAIAISPNDISLSGEFTLAVDVWMNYYADPEKVGTTEFAGILLGFDPNGGPINGSGLFGSGDGDAAVDYRLFGDSVELPIESGQYLVESQNNVDPPYIDVWPALETPDAQIDNFDPPNEFEVTPDGALAFDWHTFRAVVDTDAGEALLMIDDLEIGILSTELDGGELDGNVALAYWDLFSSVAPVSEFAFGVFDNFRIETDDVEVSGDVNGDGVVDASDIDFLSAAIRNGTDDPSLDLNQDDLVNNLDRETLVNGLLDTWFGDANLDGEFNSGDLVVTFSAGKYETGAAALWNEGDWDGDGHFDSSDLVRAFAGGGYEQGPRPATAIVPEPSSAFLVAIASIVIFWHRVQ